jgi:hypothetical protein
MSSFSLFLQKVLFSKGNLDPIAPSYDAELLFVIKDKSIGETKPVMTEFPKLKCQGMLSHLSTWVVSFAVCSFLDPFAMLLHLCVLEYSNLVDMFFFYMCSLSRRTSIIHHKNQPSLGDRTSSVLHRSLSTQRCYRSTLHPGQG